MALPISAGPVLGPKVGRCGGEKCKILSRSVRHLFVVLTYLGCCLVLVFVLCLEGPAIRTAIVTKERCEPAGRELVSVRVQAGAKSVVPA